MDEWTESQRRLAEMTEALDAMVATVIDMEVPRRVKAEWLNRNGERLKEAGAKVVIVGLDHNK